MDEKVETFVLLSKSVGVDLIIDDTPELVVISSFNVVRREIARQTILKLLADGRIHPAKIEEFHEKSKQEMDRHTLRLGEKAQMEIECSRDSPGNSQASRSSRF